MPAAGEWRLAIPNEDPLGQILGDDFPLLAGAYRQTAPGAVGLSARPVGDRLYIGLGLGACACRGTKCAQG